ncbi:MAG TPA: SprT-like domain-containing protein [Nevskiaceae bacterium]|nr:SprT-like domain-containing protein [Nevskiaceae bacterium]
MRRAPGFWQQRLTAPWQAVPLCRDARGQEWEEGAQGRDPRKVRARVEQAVDHWIAQARQLPGLDRLAAPLPRPPLHYDLRGEVAGMAVSERRPGETPRQWIRLHPELLLRYPVRMIQQTLPHEIAHLAVDWYLPRASDDPHGPEWMAVMVYFGRPPLVSHTMQIQPPRRSRRRDPRALSLPL